MTPHYTVKTLIQGYTQRLPKKPRGQWLKVTLSTLGSLLLQPDIPFIDTHLVSVLLQCV